MDQQAPSERSQQGGGAANRQKPRNAGEMLELGRDFLRRREVPGARRDAELLVAFALGLERLQLFLQLDRPVSDEDIDRARELLMRRAKREPVAYITGQREFYGRPFQVDRRVLVPRPETELVVDIARERAPAGAAVADLGTGSGCLAITLALEIPEARVVASDVSSDALELARANAAALAADVTLVEGDGPAALAPQRHGLEAWDVFVSNPPYVDPSERSELEPEVREHEPDLALFAPAGDPDVWVRRLLDEALAWLAPGGVLLVELGLGQGPRVLALAAERGLAARLHTDLAGVPRVLEASAAR